MNIFITGATGFLGSYLLKQLLDDGYHCHLLVRCLNKATGKLRILESLDEIKGNSCINPDQIHIIPGDLTQPLLGLNALDLENVIQLCDQFIHCAASVRFDLSYDEAHAVNVNGTKEFIEIAQLRKKTAQLKRVDIVSTAYIAGATQGLVKESAPLNGIRFRNTYEQTKHEAELYATEKMAELPITIFRPSIIVGEASNGKTHNFNTIYSFLKMYARGQWRILPANKNTPIDLVSVDYVRDAMMAIRQQPESIGGFFHLTAGEGNVLSVGDIAALAEKHCETDKKVIYQPVKTWLNIILPLFTFCLYLVPIRKYQSILSVLKSYLPYTQQNPQFNDDNTQQFLAASGISSANIKTSIESVFAYAIASNFGRYSIKNYSYANVEDNPVSDTALAMNEVSMGS